MLYFYFIFYYPAKLAMVVPCYVLDNPKRHSRKQIAEVANLVDAYRMPENLFDNAKITVDIVVFQRTSSPKKDWTDTVFIELPNKERFCIARYFADHPDYIIGKLDTYEAYSFFEDKPRKGLKCVAPFEEVQKRLPELVNTVQPLSLS